jgi:hypothetical protein
MKLRYIIFCLPLVLSNLSASEFPGISFQGKKFNGEERAKREREWPLFKEPVFEECSEIGHDFIQVVFNTTVVDCNMENDCIGCFSLDKYNTFFLNNELLVWYAQRTMEYKYNLAYEFLCRNSDIILSAKGLAVLPNLLTKKVTAPVERIIHAFFLADMLHEREILHPINIDQKALTQETLKSVNSYLRSIGNSPMRDTYTAIRDFVAHRAETYK